MQKIGLSITFLTGCIGTVTGIVRLIYFFKINMFEDVTWDAVETMSWTLIEPGVYMIAATLPSLRPLLKWALKDTKISALATSLLDRASRVLSSNRSAKGTVADEKAFHPPHPEINTKTTITAKSVPKNAKMMGLESDSDTSSADMV
ncbi:uncharacterized protein KY384_003589 [Bacidia gigantensis]|uniref:uncharacterized protein n=1 Tax=Bacidia gigantensis TaxID=2732470 RepID=UPI001D055C05|nr:uncharacterized protein KY384_003589 [Bacidia gigantensis]KAG8531953.1 hypothetical protein KY384_003589 [Bacidia gigantensis]